MKFNMLTITLPEITGFSYTREYRKPKNGEFYRKDYVWPDRVEYQIKKWQNHLAEHENGQYFIMEPDFDLTSFGYTVTADNVYSQEAMENFDPNYLIDDFRFPKPGEMIFGRNGKISEFTKNNYTPAPLFILKKKGH